PPRDDALAFLLILHLHQVGQGTFTPKLSIMLGTQLRRSFRTAPGDTAFFSALYQDLSEPARRAHGLVATPVFVEEFILDYTLRPAIEEFGLEAIRLIDPTCGSGTFLLGAFQRLVAFWADRLPAVSAVERVSRALAAIHGVDINPFASAIARF